MNRALTMVLTLVLLAGCAGIEPSPPAQPEPPALPTQSPDTSTVPSPSRAPTAAVEPTLPAVDSPLATPTPAENTGVIAVWVQEGDLVLRRLPAGEEVRLTNLGDVVDFPEFSPDRQLILFRRQSPAATISNDPAAEVPTTTLWAIQAAGGTPRLLLDPLDTLPPVPGTGALADDLYPSEPGPLAWLPEGRQVLFSSRYLTVNAALPNNDLWALDVETAQLDALLPAGQGGRPVVSPDGSLVLLSTPTELAASATDGSQRRTLLTFERVPTYSEWEWLPEPVWSADGSAQVAIAEPWQVSEPVTYTLQQVEVASGESQELGRVQVPWLHTPRWSPDGSRLAYMSAGSGLMLGGRGGENPRLVAEGEMSLPLAWSPAGTRLVFLAEDQYCVVEDRQGSEPVCVAPVWDASVLWLDEDNLAVMADAGEDQPQLQAIELPAGTVRELWTAPPAPLYYDLAVGRSPEN